MIEVLVHNLQTLKEDLSDLEEGQVGQGHITFLGGLSMSLLPMEAMQVCVFVFLFLLQVCVCVCD